MQCNCLAYDIYSSWSGGDQNRPHSLSAETKRSRMNNAQLQQKYRCGAGLLCSCTCIAALLLAEAATWRHSTLLLPHLCHHSPTPAASAPLPASARDSVPLAQHHRLWCSMGLHIPASAAVVHMPAAWSRVHHLLSVHPQPCPGLVAHDLITTCAHGAAWDLMLATGDGHSVCSASWNPVPVTVAPKPSAAVAVVQSTAWCPHLQRSLGPVT